MTTLAVTKFSEVQAIAICWLANFKGPIKPAGWEGLHSEDCGWCGYPQAVKLDTVVAFDLRDDADRQRAMFFNAAPATRRALIRKAQGYRKGAA